MDEVDLDAPVRPWGNSMGVIIPADIVRRLNLRPGETVHLRLHRASGHNRVDALPKWDFVTEVDVDAILDEEFGA